MRCGGGGGGLGPTEKNSGRDGGGLSADFEILAMGAVNFALTD